MIGTLETVAADLELARNVRTAERQRTDSIDDIDDVLTEWDDDRSIDSNTEDQEILKHIQAFNDEAERINDLESTIDERDQIKGQINSRLENESAQDAFRPLREADEPWIDVVRNAATEQADTDAIANAIRAQKPKSSSWRTSATNCVMSVSSLRSNRKNSLPKMISERPEPKLKKDELNLSDSESHMR